MIDHCIDMDVDGGPEISSEKMVRARVEHVCCECGNPIKPGDLYELVKGKWEGEWATYKTCRICKGVKDDFFHTYAFGEIWEMMRETYGLGYDGIMEPGQYDSWDQDDQARADMLLKKPAERSGHRSSIREIRRQE